MQISDLELANDLPFREANELRMALNAALDAMVYYGSGDDDIGVIAMLHVVAKRQESQALKRAEDDDNAKAVELAVKHVGSASSTAI